MGDIPLRISVRAARSGVGAWICRKSSNFSDLRKTPIFEIQCISRLPLSLSQFEETIGHWRGRGGGDGESLVDCLQDEAAVEAPGEGAEVAREMFGRDGAVRGQEAVFDVGEHGICPAEGGVSGGGAVGAGDVALVDETRLPRNATKPLPAVADDSGSGFDAGA